MNTTRRITAGCVALVLLALVASQDSSALGQSPNEPTPAREGAQLGGRRPRVRAPRTLRRSDAGQSATDSRPENGNPENNNPEDSNLEDDPASVRSTRRAADDPERKTDENAAEPAKREAKNLIYDAYHKTKTANNEVAYTEIIALCRSGLDAHPKPETAAYGRNLLGWAYNRRGEARAAEGHEKEALADFETAIKYDPQHWRAVHNRGVSRAMAGRYKEAMTDFNRTIELYQGYSNAFFNRGELRYEQGDYYGAIDDYSRALRLAPRDTTVFNSRGHTYYRLNRFRDALNDYNEALEVQPDNGAVLTNRGDVYADVGDYAAAARDYRAAIRVAPRLGRAYLSAAWLMSTCPDAEYRNAKLGLEAAEKAIEIDGDNDYRYLETLAAALANSDKFEEAEATQNRVVQMAPTDQLARHEERRELFRHKKAFREGPAPGREQVSEFGSRERN